MRFYHLTLALLTVAGVKIASGQSESHLPISLAPGYTPKTIGTVSAVCSTQPTVPTNCITTGDARLLSLSVGNMANHAGSMYGTTLTSLPDGTPSAQQELFVVSPEGISAKIADFSTNRNCTISQAGVTGSQSWRGMTVLGYNLGVSALYVRIEYTQSAQQILNPQDGFVYQCQNGGLVLTGSDGTKTPSTQTTSTTTTTIVKITNLP